MVDCSRAPTTKKNHMIPPRRPSFFLYHVSTNLLIRHTFVLKSSALVSATTPSGCESSSHLAAISKMEPDMRRLAKTWRDILLLLDEDVCHTSGKEQNVGAHISKHSTTALGNTSLNGDEPHGRMMTIDPGTNSQFGRHGLDLERGSAQSTMSFEQSGNSGAPSGAHTKAEREQVADFLARFSDPEDPLFLGCSFGDDSDFGEESGDCSGYESESRSIDDELGRCQDDATKNSSATLTQPHEPQHPNAGAATLEPPQKRRR